MRRIVALTLFFTVLVIPGTAQYGQYSSRALLEKKIYYVSDGKVGTSDFWALHLGKHSAPLRKYYPGEGEVIVNSEVNFSLLSSSYIEGVGYSSKGKIQAEAEFALAAGDSSTEIPLDSIGYVYKWGRMVKPVGEEAATLLLRDESGNAHTIKRMTLRKFVFNKEMGELKFDADIPVSAFSFTKSGINEARKIMAEEAAKEQ